MQEEEEAAVQEVAEEAIREAVEEAVQAVEEEATQEAAHRHHVQEVVEVEHHTMVEAFQPHIPSPDQATSVHVQAMKALAQAT